MIKSKISLHFNKIVICLFIISILYTSYVLITNSYYSNYNINTKEITGYLNEITIDGNKLTMEIRGQENIIISYYISSYEELMNIKNNYELGDYFKIEGTNTLPSVNTNFNLFNYRRFLLSKKTYWIFKANKINLIKKNNNINYKIKTFIIDRIENINYNKEYLYAFILGNSQYIDDNIMSSYQNNGITHLLAISGMQVMLLALIISKVGKLLITNEKILFIIIMFLLLLYAFLINYSPSIMRAIILYALLTVNKMYSFKINQKGLFIGVFSLFLLYNPYFMYNLGFLFSFTICFYLLLFKDYINTYHHYLTKLLITSFIAFLVSLPIIIDNFYEINILTPILNLIFIPLVTFIIYPLAILTIIFPFFHSLLNITLSIMENISLVFNNLSIFNLIMAKPSLVINLMYYFLITIILYDLKHHQYRFIPILIITIFIHNHINILSLYSNITFIDVGQGDSTLISLPHNQGNILIDTGGIIEYNTEEWKKRRNSYSIAENTIIPYLKSLGIKQIDYLILSHGDYDHIGEACNLISNFKINSVILNSGSNNKIENNIIELLKNKKISSSFFNKKTLNINKYSLKFLNDKNSKDENKDSLIVLANLDNRHILLMGDASRSEELKLNEYIKEKVDILKVGHHGSNTSTDELFVKTLKPALGVISAGRNNRFHHPHEITLEVLKKYRVMTYVTSINGSIKFVLKNKLTVYTCL